MIVKRYNRKPSFVDAMQVTADNMTEVANWCLGEVRIPSGPGNPKPYVKIVANKSTEEKYTKAFVGYWVLRQKSPTGHSFKVYADKAFKNLYEDSSLHAEAVVEDSPVVGTPIYDAILLELQGAMNAMEYISEPDQFTQVAGEAAHRVVKLMRGDGVTELIPTHPETSTFFMHEPHGGLSAPVIESAADVDARRFHEAELDGTLASRGE